MAWIARVRYPFNDGAYPALRGERAWYIHMSGRTAIVADLSEILTIQWLDEQGIMIPMSLFMAMKQFADGLGKHPAAYVPGGFVHSPNVLVNYAFIFGNGGAPPDGNWKRWCWYPGVKSGDHDQYYHPHFLRRICFMQTAPSEQLQFGYTVHEGCFRIGVPSVCSTGMGRLHFAVSGIMAGWRLCAAGCTSDRPGKWRRLPSWFHWASALR